MTFLISQDGSHSRAHKLTIKNILILQVLSTSSSSSNVCNFKSNQLILSSPRHQHLSQLQKIAMQRWWSMEEEAQQEVWVHHLQIHFWVDHLRTAYLPIATNWIWKMKNIHYSLWHHAKKEELMLTWNRKQWIWKGWHNVGRGDFKQLYAWRNHRWWVDVAVADGSGMGWEDLKSWISTFWRVKRGGQIPPVLYHEKLINTRRLVFKWIRTSPQ
jgi:hypothetical protein